MLDMPNNIKLSPIAFILNEYQKILAIVINITNKITSAQVIKLSPPIKEKTGMEKKDKNKIK